GPVTAHVRERAQPAVVVAQHSDRLPRDAGRPVLAGSGDVADMACEVPGPGEDVAHLPLVDLRRCVGAGGKGDAGVSGYEAHARLSSGRVMDNSCSTALRMTYAASSCSRAPVRICRPMP